MFIIELGNKSCSQCEHRFFSLEFEEFSSACCALYSSMQTLICHSYKGWQNWHECTLSNVILFIAVVYENASLKKWVVFLIVSAVEG
jgi:hypothetical protein